MDKTFSKERISEKEEILDLLRLGYPSIDVRAPIEFKKGSVDHSVNLPILNDEEREIVGTTYKEKGQDEAIQIGHQLVSGSVKEARVQGWAREIKSTKAFLYCYRGGLRSQTAQRWLFEVGIKVPILEGGYKRVRHLYLEYLDSVKDHPKWYVISGPTGSGKTDLIRELMKSLPAIDLEFIAKHRGSAFGAYDEPQPEQADFENKLASRLISLESEIKQNGFLFVEDESRMIGKIHQPLAFFEKLRSSEVIWIDDPIEVRVQRIMKEYVEVPLQKFSSEFVFSKLRSAIDAISKKLGAEKTSKMKILMNECQHQWELSQKHESLKLNEEWILDLLNIYYDPLYLRSLDRRQVNVAFKGNYKECIEFVKRFAGSELI